MVKILGGALLVAMLAGCATPADQAWRRLLAGLSSSDSPAQFHFDWQISGDPSLAPLQVFDDGRQTWLQYPSDQPVPAVFGRTASGDRLLQPRREGDFLVVPEVPERLILRGGHLQAEVWHKRKDLLASDSMDSPGGAVEPSVVVSPESPAGVFAIDKPTVRPTATGPAPLPLQAAAPVVPPAPVPIPPPSPVPSVVPATPAGKPMLVPAATAPYEATPADGNIRRTLGRWAKRSGWTFEAQHWAVDVDIPLAGSAEFGPEFIPAVRDLLAATELGDRPLQPCFYANRVLRVVPFAQRCDRTQMAGAAS
ncbi:MAG TPA: TcpQ domain-containing protein [Castellaniella sp.]|uniref:TcpQ domain-containing protein n=1 Tax=Castellaniella sp. TaxID=1955812 RepID=UPI002F039233